MATGDRERNPVEYLAEEFLERRRRGEETSIDEYARAHPEQSAEIRALFPTILEMEDFKEKRIGAVSLDVEQLSGLRDYRIIREIGRGGMGVVYEAEQQSLGRRVALKVLPPRAVSQSSRAQRFENEARAAARLHHTNIVPVFGTGEHSGCHFYVMQYIPGLSLDRVMVTLRGETEEPSSTVTTDDLQTKEVISMLLRDRLAGSDEATKPTSSDAGEQASATAEDESAPPPSYRGNYKYYRSIARIGVQVADALHYAHSQGTLHRDIKPANLLLDGRGTVWVTDFGLAKTVEQDDLTRSGDIVGTLGYMAPEQAQGQFDARSDIYSLGLTLYEMIVMRPAKSGQGEVLDRIVRGNLQPLRSIDPAVPRDLAIIIDKACAADPAHRYRSAAELEEDLQRFIEERPILARKVSVIESVWRWSRRNRAMAVLAASTIWAVIAAGVTGWVGYGITTSALSREQVATERAEANLSLSLEAFDDIFTKISGPDPFQSVLEDPDTGEFAAVSSTPISLEDAELLDEMLAFYDRFAAQNADNADLQWETAKAHRRVGDIQQRLGRYEDAATAYQESLRLYEGLAFPPERENQWTTEVAIVQNQLGRIEMAQGNGDSAREAHEFALVLLEEVPEAERSEAQQLELARTHNLRGLAMAWGPEPGRGGFPQFRRGRGGGGQRGRNVGGRGSQRSGSGRGSGRGTARGTRSRGRGQGRGQGRGGRATTRIRRGPRGSRLAVAEHQEALQIVETLLVKSPDNPEFRLAEARAHRLLSNALRFSDAEAARGSKEEAIQVLNLLVEEFPDSDPYRFELIETLVTPVGRRSATNPVFDEAISMGQDLVEDNPTIPEYRASLARVRMQLGVNLWRNGDRSTAEVHMREALLQESALAKILPDLDDHLVQWSRSTLRVYRNLFEDDPEGALQLLVASAEELGLHLEQSSASRRTGERVAEVFRELAEALEASGNSAEAIRARQRAAELSGRR